MHPINLFFYNLFYPSTIRFPQLNLVVQELRGGVTKLVKRDLHSLKDSFPTVIYFFFFLVTSLKPDIFIVNEHSEEVFVFELTCPWDRNITRSHTYKSEKYAPLVADLAQTRVVSFFSIEVSARGQITKENRSRLKCFLHKTCTDPAKLFKPSISIASKSALLSSYSIFAARREPTWEDPSPMIVR